MKSAARIKLLATILMLIPLFSNAGSMFTHYECSTSYTAHHLTRPNTFVDVPVLKQRYLYSYTQKNHKLARIEGSGLPSVIAISDRKYPGAQWHRLEIVSDQPGSAFTFYEQTSRFSISEITGFLVNDPNISARIIFGACNKITEEQYQKHYH